MFLQTPQDLSQGKVVARFLKSSNITILRYRQILNKEEVFYMKFFGGCLYLEL